MEKTEIKGWKKLLNAISIAIAILGSFVLLVFSIMINDAVDKTKSTVSSNIDSLYVSLGNIETAFVVAEDELDAANTTVDELQDSIGPLSEGLRSTAGALDGTAETFSLLELVTPGISAYTSELKGAADSLDESADRLDGSVSTFDEHKDTLGELKESISGIRESVSFQRAALGETKKSMEEVFNLMKIANILFFFVVMSIFLILILRSATGFI